MLADFSTYNLVSFIVVCIVGVYFFVGYVLLFLRYKSIHSRFYSDIPLMDLIFFMICFAVGEVLMCGITSDGMQFAGLLTLVLITILVLYPVCIGLMFLLIAINKWRSKLPLQ